MSWLEHWIALRDRLTSNAKFRRWAASNPLTRSIARRRARDLFDLCAGFVYSQVLLACVQLRVFEVLREAPGTTPELARRLRLPVEATERLLRAACALRLCEARTGHRYGLGPLGAAMIDNAGLVAMIEHHAILYSDLRDPIALLRGEMRDTALSRYWAYARSASADALDLDATAPYTALMAASHAMIADEVLDAYPLHQHACLLDVGGGDGSFVAAAAARNPRLRFILFDLPSVAHRACARIASEGITERATVIGGDFFADPLPNGADIISLVRVLHDHDTEAALQILSAARLALPAGGTLLIAEPMAQTPGARRVGDAYFGFYFMAMGQGRARTQQEIASLLQRAGFLRIRHVSTRIPLIASLTVARV